MITNSNPFLRNDYYPDQNDIDELNTRINEVQSDVDLLAISVNEQTEAVNGRLNNLQNDYNESFETDALKANTADLNVLNVNVQAVVKDLNVIDTYTENLIVNKPVQDLSLRTPHLENTTSLNGNFYAPNIIDGKIDNIQFENIQNFKAVNIEADVFKANVTNLNVLNAINIEADGIKVNTVDLNKVTANTIDLNVLNANEIIANVAGLNVLNAVNIEADEIKANKLIGDFFSAEPISSSAAVGYDENGQLIPIRASYDVAFPEDADYLKTDARGTARKGTSESEVVQSINLIQAGAVQNMYDAVNANVQNMYDAVNASFDSVNASFDNIQNTFNDFANNLNNVSLAENLLNDVNNTFNNVNNTLNDVSDYIFNGFYLPGYGNFNSSSPVDYRNATSVKIYGDARGGTNLSDGGGQILFNASTNEVVFGFSGSTACRGITSCNEMFNGCIKLNQSIKIPLGVEDCTRMFEDCVNLNQNITIPNTVKDCTRMFNNCFYLNQNILIPNGVTTIAGTFNYCKSLNQNILIPNNVVNMSETFSSCSRLNQNIQIPNGVVNMVNTFDSCDRLNQNILIPNSVTNISRTFIYCNNLNQNISIPNNVVNMSETFSSCSRLNQNILIPNSVTNMYRTFRYCNNLNQSDIYIYSQNLSTLENSFTGCHINNVHIPTSVPKDTSNLIYRSLTNGVTGITFPAANIFNDLPVNPTVWPPIN